MDLVEFLRARIDEDAAWARDPECSQDPHRLFAECDAKRKIIDLHEGEHMCQASDEGVYFAAVSGTEERYVNGVGGHLEGCQTLRTLALPYADHPDYREEWRP